MEISREQFLQIIEVLGQSLNIKQDNIFSSTVNDRKKLLGDIIDEKNISTDCENIKFKNYRYEFNPFTTAYRNILWEPSDDCITKKQMEEYISSSYIQDCMRTGGIYGEIHQHFDSVARASSIYLIDAAISIKNIFWDVDKLCGDVIFIDRKLIDINILEQENDDRYKSFKFIPRIVGKRLVTFDIEAEITL